jgi:hypothetical protein
MKYQTRTRVFIIFCTCLILISLTAQAAKWRPSAPGVTTQSATAVSSSGATLNGTVNPKLKATTYYFEYGTSTAYGTRTTTASAGGGASTAQVSATVSGLTASTTYHFRLVATNSVGTSYGADSAFTTSASAQITTYSAPGPSFSYNPSYPVTGSPITFDGTTSKCYATPCSYRWTDDSDGSLLGTGATMSFTFQQAGTRYIRLTMTDAQSQTAGIEHDVIVSVSTSSNGTLTWRPPACGDSTHACADVYLTTTGSHQNPSLNNNTDYRLHLPQTGPLVGGLTISGGHNVQIIGGEIDLTYPCSDSSSACHGINISRGSAAGQVYVEGVYIKNPDPNYLTDKNDTGDGIDVDDYPGVTDIVLQNVRVDGIKGCDPAVPAAHADVFQPYNAGGATYEVDHLTATTDCQGMQIDPDYAYSTYGLLPKAATIKNVNINIFANPSSGNGNRYGWWFTYDVNSCVSYPITLSNVYTKEPDGTLYDNAVWPDPANGYPSGCVGTYNGGYVSWPALSTLSGGITTGLPPGGDFVPAGVAGIGYVSPGYQ